MLHAILARLHQRHRTVRYPAGAPVLPDRLCGRPTVIPDRCGECSRNCIEVCPTQAIRSSGNGISIDLGRCLFCSECKQACPKDAISFSSEYRMATTRREDLVVGTETYRLAGVLEEKSRKLFGRSLRLRQVSAGGCNACEADINVLSTVVFDLARFGVQFVASPRHADGLLITGPVTENMRLALEKTYEAVSAPKMVIAVGCCAISGGPFIDHPEVHNGAGILPRVDLYIPGCPPHPYTILDGILQILGKIERSRSELPA